MIENNENIVLIVKFLNNELNDEELALFNRKIAEEDSFRHLTQSYEKLWNLLAENYFDEDVLSIDIEKEWIKQKSKVAINDRKIIDFKAKKKKQITWILSVAASVLLLVGLFFIFRNKEQVFVAENNIATAVLPDSSIVVLNRQSKIVYPKNFENNRSVKLEGNAFFSVKHKEQTSFVVEAGEFLIRVVGTEFYINTVDSFEVDVSRGIVSVKKKDNPSDSVLLHAGERIVYKNEKIVKQKLTNNNYLAWKNKKIVFRQTPLKDVCMILERTYGVEIQIADPKISKLKLTATFDHKQLKSVLKVIQETFDIKIVKQNDKYIVY